MIAKTLAHYEIMNKIGSGGMGEVYRAHDTRLDRDVAIKLLPEKISGDASYLARFEREAKAIAALNHPNIVTIHSVEDADGQRFFTMELVSGKPLDDLIPDSGIDFEKFFDVSIPLADALATAHDKGITHRDLKPANVMVSDEGRVKVLDFGLAKLLEPDTEFELTQESPSQPLTQEGFVVGTFPYMSPEQIEGRAIDHRSDIFSLGVILYEMITGIRPFHGNSSAAIISSILRDTPSSIGRFRSEAPSRLESIIDHCLEKDVSRRYANAKDLREDLEQLKRDISSTSLLRSTSTSQISRVRQMIVVLPFENMGPAEDDYFADGITEEITSRLSAVREIGVISRTTAGQYDRKGKTVKQIGRDLGVDFVMEGTVRWAKASGGTSRVRITPQLVRVSDDTNLWNERYDRVIDDIFEIQSDIAEKVIEQLGVTLHESEREAIGSRPTENLEAYEAYLRALAIPDRFGRAGVEAHLVALEKAIELDPDFFEAWVALTQASSTMIFFSYDESDNMKAKAKHAAERTRDLQPDSPRTHLALGYYYYHGCREYERAEKEFAIAQKALPNDAEVLAARGYILRRMGRWESAMTNLDRAILLNPQSAMDLWNHANDFAMNGKHEKARQLFDRSIELSPEDSAPIVLRAFNEWAWKGDGEAALATLRTITMKDDDPWQAWGWWMIHLLAGKPGEALKFVSNDSWDFWKMQFANHPRMFFQAVARHHMGETDLAREGFQACRLILESERLHNATNGGVHSGLALIYAHLGRAEEARESAGETLRLVENEKDHYSRPFYYYDLAWAMTIAGENELALEYLEKNLSMPSLFSTTWIRNDPRLENLRSDPRLEQLLKKYDSN